MTSNISYVTYAKNKYYSTLVVLYYMYLVGIDFYLKENFWI